MATYSKQCSAVGGYSYADNFKLYIELTETDVNVSNNTSKIKYKVYCKSSGSGSISARHYEYFKLNGQEITDETVNVSASSPNANIPIASGTTSAITHNSDGTKSVSFEAEIEASSYGVKASKSGTFTLSTIARKSPVSASAANIGANSTITISRASSSFTHTLTYTFGSLSGTIATKTTSTSVAWTLPDNFYSQIPNSKSGTGTITCTTYNGNTSLGSTTCSFTANAVESAARPTLSATITDINSTTTALTGNNQKIVLNASTARIVVTSGLRKNAGSISSVKINNVNVGSSASITKDYTNVTASTFTITTTDSRGYSTTITLSPTTVNYIPLTLNAQVFRPTPTSGEIALKYNGNYFNGSFGNQSNTLTVSYKYKESTASTYTIGGVSITPTISGNTYSRAQTSLGTTFTYTNAYNFIVTVSDKIRNLSFTTTVSRGMPVFYWGKDFLRVNHSLRIPKNSTAGYGLCNSDGASIIRDWNNSNVVVDATGGWLFLGYQNTTNLNLLNGKMTLDSSGNATISKSLKIPKDGTAGYGICNADGTSIIRDHGNRNVTVNATGDVLLLGYQTTNSINFMNGKATMTSAGRLTLQEELHAHTLIPNANLTYNVGSAGWAYNRVYANQFQAPGIGGVIVAGDNSSNMYFGTSGSYSGKTANLRGNTVRLYAHSGSAVYLGASGTTAVTSDEQLKDIFNIDDKYINFYNNLIPIMYKYKTPTAGKRPHFGFGARQVEQALQNAGLETKDFAGILIDTNVNIPEDEWGKEGGKHFDKLYSLRYEEFIALNTKMIQKTMAENNDLKNKVIALEERLTALENV